MAPSQAHSLTLNAAWPPASLSAHNRSRLIAIASRSAALAPHSACVMAFEIGIGSELTAQNHPDLAAGAETENLAEKSSRRPPPLQFPHVVTISMMALSGPSALTVSNDLVRRPRRALLWGLLGMPSSLHSQINNAPAYTTIVEFGGNDFSP